MIVAAIHGETYCYSTRTAFKLLLSNVLRVAAVSTTSLMLLFLGKLFVVASATAAAWAWIRFDPLAQVGVSDLKCGLCAGGLSARVSADTCRDGRVLFVLAWHAVDARVFLCWRDIMMMACSCADAA